MYFTFLFFQIICQACSSNKHGLDYMKNQPARVCDLCFKELQKHSKLCRGLFLIFLYSCVCLKLRFRACCFQVMKQFSLVELALAQPVEDQNRIPQRECIPLYVWKASFSLELVEALLGDHLRTLSCRKA